MDLFAAVQPLVRPMETYQDMYGEDDPEELTLMQMKDRELAERIAGVLQDLYGLEVNLTEPREDEGLDEWVGMTDDLHELRRIAAAVHGKTEEDYQEGRVQAGFQFNHLINHDDEEGFYLPVDFMQAFAIEEISIGSAVALLNELGALEPVLAAQFPVDMNLALATPDDAEKPDLAGPVSVWLSLRRLCRSAIELDLPIRFG
jgi:hypothetical protein